MNARHHVHHINIKKKRWAAHTDGQFARSKNIKNFFCVSLRVIRYIFGKFNYSFAFFFCLKNMSIQKVIDETLELVTLCQL